MHVCMFLFYNVTFTVKLMSDMAAMRQVMAR